MLNIAYKLKLDSVVKIVIVDNVFIGHQFVMPNITIGPISIVSVESVVIKNVTLGDTVGGAPAKVIGKVDVLVDKFKKQIDELHWGNIIHNGEGSFDSVEDQ